jgi:hypothetical protein
MRAAYDGEPGADAACRGDALANFRVLLQVSLDQLYDACSTPRAPGDRTSWRNAHCDRAAMGEPPPRVPGTSPDSFPEWRRQSGEPELEYSTRLLAAHGFRFEDLGVPAGRGDLAVGRIRTAITGAADRLAAAQPAQDRWPLTVAARLAADSTAHSTRNWTRLAVGPMVSEFGVLPVALCVTAALGWFALLMVLANFVRGRRRVWAHTRALWRRFVPRRP